MSTSKSNFSFTSALKAGAIAGFIGAGINNVWSLIANLLGATIPPGFAMAITIASIFPLLVGAILFFVLVRFITKGNLVWLIASVGFLLVSFYPVFFTSQLPDGTITDSTFPILVGPMHACSGFLAIWGIPRWSR
jgi:hypothetical protein